MPAPTVSNVLPPIGASTGGISVTLTGTNFTGTTGVTFGGAAATQVTVVSATSLTCTLPAGTAGGASVLVTNGDGTNSANSLFFYVQAVPTDTYIYLKGGRGDGYVPAWTGLITEEGMVDDAGVAIGPEGKEVSDPYRDTFMATSQAHPDAGSFDSVAAPGGGSVSYTFKTAPALTVAAALLPANPATPETVDFTFSSGSGATTTSETIGLVPDSMKYSSSDEVAHVQPRQHAKVFTWLRFLSANGLTYKYRKADVTGWGSKRRTD